MYVAMYSMYVYNTYVCFYGLKYVQIEKYTKNKFHL